MRSFGLLVLLVGVALAAANRLSGQGAAYNKPIIGDDGFPSCGLHEQFTQCGDDPSCQDTCANKNDEQRDCPLICYIGCICNDGYVRLMLNGPCIPEHMCPPTMLPMQL